MSGESNGWSPVPVIAVSTITLTNHEERGAPPYGQWSGEATVCERPLTKVTAFADSPEAVLEKLRHAIADVVFSGKLRPCEPGCIFKPPHQGPCDTEDK